jgi:acyl-CoA carboxylase epsilon subunit
VTALRIVRGDATPEEIAALLVVLAARRPAEKPEPVRSTWADREAVLRRPMTPGPRAWRASGLPR